VSRRPAASAPAARLLRLVLRSSRPRQFALATLACCAAVLAGAGVALGMASHEGWPHTTHHVGHPNNESGVMRGRDGRHNLLLGGDGNDTIWAGDSGDVIWGDSHPGGQPTTQNDLLHGGPGTDWLYSSHGHNVIWTGAGNDHVALVYGYGTVYCDGPGLKTLVVRYLPSNRRFRLVGCTHTVIDRYRA
jgi:RTX calcium-binding nonapeptide repeat (4 copies)